MDKPTFNCPVCARTFKKKSHLDDHKSKKNDCSKSTTLSYDSESVSSYAPSVTVDPEEIELKKMELEQQRERLSLEMKHAEARQKMKGGEVCYPNQKEAALECVKAFRDGKTAVLLIALPGVGKTGCSQQVMYDMAIGKPEDSIDDSYMAERMSVLSGMNDTEWNDQYKAKLLPSFSKNIYHRGKLDKNLSTIANSKLIVNDECHVASDMNMTLDRVYKAAGIHEIEKMHERGRKLLTISATPESVEHDLKRWGNKAAKVILKPGPDYKGFRVMLNEGRICAAPRFTSYESVLKFMRNLDSRYAKSSFKRYFPIRLNINKNKDTILTWIKEACFELGWANPIHHDADSKSEDSSIDEIMSHAPSKHTPIIIKSYWTASKRLVYKYVGGTYEEIPVGKRNTTKTSQGLTARFCDNYKYEKVGLKMTDGRDEWEFVELRPLHYCDKFSIEEYLQWFENGADSSKASYVSPKINADGNGRVRAKKSTLHHSNLQGIKPEELETDPKSAGPFFDFEQVKKFLKDTFGNKVRPEEMYSIDGYKLSTRLTTYYGKKKDKLTANDRLTEEKFNDLITKQKEKDVALNISQTGKGQRYMIYPVYPTTMSSPDEVQYHIRYLPPKPTKKVEAALTESSTETPRNVIVD